MSAHDQSRGPRVFRLDDTRLAPSEPPPSDEQAEGAAFESSGEPQGRGAAARLMSLRRIGWGGVFLSALGGLVSIAIGVWIADFVSSLFAGSGWLGSAALALAVIALVAAVVIAFRELTGFFRLGRIAAIRLEAENALADLDKTGAMHVSRRIESLLADRSELKWGARRLADYRREILDARELLALTEREMIAPLDREARALIAASVRRVALITAVSPSAIIDVLFVATANLAMLRRLAALYGGRPGFLGSLKLARLVLSHLALTGTVALGDDVIQQLVGHGLTARLSARLGEGLLNGAFTGRIGIAAVDLCRPLPYIEAERPKLRAFLAELRVSRRGRDGDVPRTLKDE